MNIKKYHYVYLGSNIDYQLFYRNQSKIETNRVFVNNYVLNNMGPFHRFLFRLHFSKKMNCLLRLPFKHIWSKYFLDSSIAETLETIENLCFCVSGLEYGLVKNGFLTYLRKRYPNAVIALFLTDTVSFYNNYYKGFSIEKIKTEFDLVFTYNHLDSIKYELNINPPRICSYENVDSMTCGNIDVFFVGRNKNRLNTIIGIAEVCRKHNLSIYFHIIGVRKNEQIPYNGIHYGSYLPFNKVLAYEKKAKCILNIYQKQSDGITMRDSEAIGMNKFLITDGKAIYNTVFYTPQKIINVNRLEEEICKINENNQGIEWCGKKENTTEMYFCNLDVIISKWSGNK